MNKMKIALITLKMKKNKLPKGFRTSKWRIILQFCLKMLDMKDL